MDNLTRVFEILTENHRTALQDWDRILEKKNFSRGRITPYGEGYTSTYTKGDIKVTITYDPPKIMWAVRSKNGLVSGDNTSNLIGAIKKFTVKE